MIHAIDPIRLISYNQRRDRAAQKESRQREALLNKKIDDLNRDVSKERLELAKEEEVVNKKIRDNESACSKKMNELEEMKVELSKVVREYKRKSEK